MVIREVMRVGLEDKLALGDESAKLGGVRTIVWFRVSSLDVCAMGCSGHWGLSLTTCSDWQGCLQVTHEGGHGLG